MKAAAGWSMNASNVSLIDCLDNFSSFTYKLIFLPTSLALTFTKKKRKKNRT